MSEQIFDAIKCLVNIDKAQDVRSNLDKNILDSMKVCNINFEDIINSTQLKKWQIKLNQTDSIQWRFICTSCYFLTILTDAISISKENLLSINQKKNIKSLLQFIVSYGILPSLLPGIGLPYEKRNPDFQNSLLEHLNSTDKYARLKSLTYFMNDIYRQPDLKEIILVNFFSDFLAALFQISYAAIIKPNSTISVDNTSFVMTEDLWKMFQKEQREFRNILDSITLNSYQPFLIKELIVLQGAKNPPLPNFMKKALSKYLSNCLIAPGGLYSLMECFLDTPNIDTGTQWKHIDIVTRIVSVKHGTLSDDDYLKNICAQIDDIIQKYDNDFVTVAAACVTNLYEKFNANQNIEELIRSIISPLTFDNQTAIPGSIILSSPKIIKIVNTIDLCFGKSKLCLPSHLLTYIIYPLFALRAALEKNSSLSTKLNNLLIKHFYSNSCKSENWFSALIYRKSNEEITVNDTIIFELESNEVVAKCNTKENSLSVELAINCILEIINDSPDNNRIASDLFLFLLESISYYKKSQNYSLYTSCNKLERDSELFLMISNTLENLIQMECVLDSFKNDPSPVIIFITNLLSEYVVDIDNKNSEDCLMISLMLLSTILSDIQQKKILKTNIEELERYLEILLKKSTNEHVKYLSQEVTNALFKKTAKHHKQISKFDEAISQVCDPLLPVRAHGLMELTKLIEEKDSETISKKHLVQCIFQENLKNADSYVYLSAINGLSTLAIHSTEDVLEILSKQYFSEIDQSILTSNAEDESIKLRMKVGEILLKITKKLGDKSLEHKNILLNTFLCGCHDTDDLMRASSLSNLAELCRVLSYKLGSIIFEILKCIDNIIQNDESQECRRAAVLVISSLIKGLGEESLLYLKDTLLPIYRTLKKLYCDEKEDPAVKLHAQIALEELNDIMGELLKPYLHS